VGGGRGTSHRSRGCVSGCPEEQNVCAGVIVAHSPPPRIAADSRFPVACDGEEENRCDLWEVCVLDSVTCLRQHATSSEALLSNLFQNLICPEQAFCLGPEL
jgi:hypothetical protein